MKRFVMTLALTCVFSSSALAGDIPTDGSASPAPGQTTHAITATSPGVMPSVGLAEQVADAALSGLLAVFALLSV